MKLKLFVLWILLFMYSCQKPIAVTQPKYTPTKKEYVISLDSTVIENYNEYYLMAKSFGLNFTYTPIKNNGIEDSTAIVRLRKTFDLHESDMIPLDNEEFGVIYESKLIPENLNCYVIWYKQRHFFRIYIEDYGIVIPNDTTNVNMVDDPE